MDQHLQVLVVDDDPDILEVLSSFLLSQGYKVKAHASGAEALESLRITPFDLMITDAQMAGMNGFELVRIVRANFPKIGIVIMTGFEGDFPLSEALRAGADGYITKPFSLSKFSLIFEKAYWHALQRGDWWDKHMDKGGMSGPG